MPCVTNNRRRNHMALHEYQKQRYKMAGLIAALIVLPIAGFFVGILYQKQTGASPTNVAQNTRGRFGGMLRDRAIGTVKSIDAGSITITSRLNNTDHTFTLTGSTTYRNGTATTEASDVKAGDTVLVTPDSNDSSKAATVTTNPG